MQPNEFKADYSSDSSTKSPDQKRQKTDEGWPADFVNGGEPANETEDIMSRVPNEEYRNILAAIDQMGLEDAYTPILESIHKLAKLHYVAHSEHVAEAKMEEFSFMASLYTIGCLQGLDLLQSAGAAELKESQAQRQDILDMCFFIQYLPSVRADLESLPDGAQKDMLWELFYSICPEDHTKKDSDVQDRNASRFLEEIAHVGENRQANGRAHGRQNGRS